MRQSVRIPTGSVTREPFRSRTHCARGHEWTARTERWRLRNRPGRGIGKERDCLICKRESEARRMRKNHLSMVGKS